MFRLRCAVSSPLASGSRQEGLPKAGVVATMKRYDAPRAVTVLKRLRSIEKQHSLDEYDIVVAEGEYFAFPAARLTHRAEVDVQTAPQGLFLQVGWQTQSHH